MVTYRGCVSNQSLNSSLYHCSEFTCVMTAQACVSDGCCNFPSISAERDVQSLLIGGHILKLEWE